MLTIYTTPSCSSCRKAKKWLDEYKIPYQEKNLFNNHISENDIDLMLENAENGFDDIISTRSKIFKDENLNIDNMRVNELKEFIINNPSVLKRPIMIQDEKMQVGYNDDEIRIFIPRRLREAMSCPNGVEDDCGYQEEVGRQIDSIRKSTQNNKAN